MQRTTAEQDRQDMALDTAWCLAILNAGAVPGWGDETREPDSDAFPVEYEHTVRSHGFDPWLNAFQSKRLAS